MQLSLISQTLKCLSTVELNATHFSRGFEKQIPLKFRTVLKDVKEGNQLFLVKAIGFNLKCSNLKRTKVFGRNIVF